MRRKAVKIVFLFVLLFLVSCRVEMPKDVLPPEKMEAVLYDYHLVQSMIGLSSTTGDYKEKLYYRAVFDKHNITKEMFDSSLVWYNRYPKHMISIYKNLETRMQQETDFLSSLKSAREAGVDLNYAYLVSDISELWTSSNSRMLSAVPYNNKLDFSFSTPKDSTFIAGDSLSFSFNARFVAPDEFSVKQQAIAAVRFEYSDNTIGYNEVAVDSPGYYELCVPRNFKSRLKAMDGYVFYYDNDTTCSARMILSDISLRRIHPVQSKSKDKN